MVKATAKWMGTLKEGAGTMKGASGHFDAPFTFVSRFEGAAAGTNPEELIGAAHAGCFSMFLAAQLTTAGHPPASIETTATVTLGAGPAISKIELRMGKTSLRDKKKLERVRELISAGFDMYGFLNKLGKA